MTNDEHEKTIAPEHSLRADRYPLESYNVVGKRFIRRKDGYEKASGSAVYTADVNLPGQLWLRILTCPYPHARIKSMDTAKAQRLPGVRALLRYDDPELPERADVSGHWGRGAEGYEPVLNRCGYWQGMPLGVAVAADTEEIANNALKLVEIEWEERPFNLDQEEALKPGAPLTNPEAFPNGNFVLPTQQREPQVVHGNPDEGFKEADRIIEWRMRKDKENWVGPERPCGLFKWNGEHPELWLKHQRPHLAKRQLAEYFKIPVSAVTIHCFYQGGSFGGWTQMALNMQPNIIAGIFSKRTGKPVKWQFTRREDFCGAGIDNARYHVRVGFKNDGAITAVAATSWFARKGFAHLGHFVENTRVRHILQESNGAVCNIMPGSAFRCEQNMNALCLGAVLNRVAEALGMDPTEVALKNDGAEGHTIAELSKHRRELGFSDRDSLKECLEAGKKAIDWEKKWHKPGTKRLPNGKMHGIGFTFTHEWSDSAGASAMGIRIERDDGSARILGQRCDNGCAAETAYCQIAADELGFRYEDVQYRPFEEGGFTPMTPDSSTNMAVNGYAIRNAARQLKRKILEIATTPRIPERPDMGYYPPFADYKPDDLDIKESVVFVKADPAKRMTMAELVRPAYMMGKMDIGSTEPLFAWGWHNRHGQYMGPPGPRPIFVRQAHFVEVEVDPETGQIDVTRVVNANDVGKAINPDAVEGQQYGGSVMGVSRARTEDTIYCPKTGVVLNGNLIDYKINTMLDCGPIDTIIIETGMGYGPYGSTGIGEDVATVVPTALYAAVHNAIGAWVDMPLTPDRVLRALGKIDSVGGGR
ncbi:MAG: aldehyde oxidase and xanthine dehydrogenase molybdopterin binding protein [Deltaproteobacteria bacterium]|nr:aldehyde oxidase and xanthine dehydrogenase molybdopterin binding protein [Deltaproteobacteria bacterium]